MKESVHLPISRSDSSGSQDSSYSFDADSVTTSPPPGVGIGSGGGAAIISSSAAPHLQEQQEQTTTTTIQESGLHRYHPTVSVETEEGFKDLLHNTKPPPVHKQASTILKAKAKSSASNIRSLSMDWTSMKSLIWKIYLTLPFFIITIFGTLIAYERLMHMDAHINNSGFYKPDLPSSFESASHRYDHLNIEFYDLNDYKETAIGWQNQERVLFCVPLRDASQHLPMFFGHLKNLTYPHNLIDLAFLISDTTDSTIKDLRKFLREIQKDPNLDNRFGRINIYEKDFGQVVGQTFSDRHGFAAQGPRRKLMAIARNWLLSTALRPDHSWVYWRDIDVETCPGTILEDLMHHNKDVIVPNVWRPLPDWLDYEQPYDLNSWQESEAGVELADKLDEDAVIVEGYQEYATWRPHLAYLRDPNGDPEVEMELDGIGGVSILAKASVFKSGAHFPAFSFQKHAETEAFGKLCKHLGYSVVGLPHYTIWHIYEPSSDDLKHMEWMANEERLRFEKARLQRIYDRSWKLAFEDVSKEWDNLKFNVFKNTDLTRFRQVDVDWNEVDEYLEDGNDQTINYEHFLDEDEDDVRNYDQNDPAKFLFNKYSHKKSEIDLKFKLSEHDKQKNFIQTDDVMNYGMNKGEDLFGSFPINPYLSGKNPNSMRFVKFKKNEVVKFDEPEKGSSSSSSDDGDSENKGDPGNDKNSENNADGDKNNNERNKEEIIQQQVDEISQGDQLEPDEESQKLKSKENIRQDAMAQAALKQKAAKQEIEKENQREIANELNGGSGSGAGADNSKQQEQKQKDKQVQQKKTEQKSNNAAAAAKKKQANDGMANNKDSANTQQKQKEKQQPQPAEAIQGGGRPENEADIESKRELRKIQEQIELENSINDAGVLEKVMNFQNDKISAATVDDNQVEKDSFDAETKESKGKGISADKKLAVKDDSQVAPEAAKAAVDASLDDIAEPAAGAGAISKKESKLDKLDANGLVDDINIGSSKEKLVKDPAKQELDKDVLPKKEEKN